MRPEAPKMIWQVKKWWLTGFKKFPNDWYSKFSIMILFVLYVIYLSLVFFILCQHAYFKDNTNSRKCLMHWGINLLYILKLPFQFLINSTQRSSNLQRNVSHWVGISFVIFDTFFFFFRFMFPILSAFCISSTRKISLS